MFFVLLLLINHIIYNLDIIKSRVDEIPELMDACHENGDHCTLILTDGNSAKSLAVSHLAS